MMRSPDHRAGREASLKNEVKQYRRILQKISKMKTKILCTLRDEGCPEAGQMLQSPPAEARLPGAKIVEDATRWREWAPV